MLSSVRELEGATPLRMGGVDVGGADLRVGGLSSVRARRALTPTVNFLSSTRGFRGATPRRVCAATVQII
eukprot:1646046-Lingulodinium_polyedra.AAC.1